MVLRSGYLFDFGMFDLASLINIIIINVFNNIIDSSIIFILFKF